MLALVADVVLLEAEEEGEPVEEVVVRTPLDVGRTAEVADGFESGGGGADLGITEGGMVGEEVVDGDDVVGLLLDSRRQRPSGLRWDGAVAEAHSGMWWIFGQGVRRLIQFKRMERERDIEALRYVFSFLAVRDCDNDRPKTVWAPFRVFVSLFFSCFLFYFIYFLISIRVIQISARSITITKKKVSANLIYQ